MEKLKTIKITAQTHTDLSVTLLQEYQKTGIKMTYSELIEQLIILYHRKNKEERYGKK